MRLLPPLLEGVGRQSIASNAGCWFRSKQASANREPHQQFCVQIPLALILGFHRRHHLRPLKQTAYHLDWAWCLEAPSSVCAPTATTTQQGPGNEQALPNSMNARFTGFLFWYIISLPSSLLLKKIVES